MNGSAEVREVLARLERVRRSGNGWSARCPGPSHANGDRNPSLSIREGYDGKVLLHCFAGCTFGQIVAAIEGAPVPGTDSAGPREHKTPPFLPTDAVRTWALALERARDDRFIGKNKAVYTFLNARGLGAAFEESAYGILADSMPLHPAIRWWPRYGYRLVVPMFSIANAEIVSIHARSVRSKGFRNPEGAATGCAMMNVGARDLVRGRSDSRRALLCEGLSDYLTACIAFGDSVPLLSAPGVQRARAIVEGGWVCGLDLVLAVDQDDSSEHRVPEIADAAYEHGAANVWRARFDVKDVNDLLEAGGFEQMAGLIDRGGGDLECPRKESVR